MNLLEILDIVKYLSFINLLSSVIAFLILISKFMLQMLAAVALLIGLGLYAFYG